MAGLRRGFAAVALAGGVLGIAAIAPAGSSRTVPVSVDLAKTGHSDLLGTGRVPVTLRHSLGGRVKVSAALVGSDGVSTPLGPSRTLSLARGRSRAVALPLSAPGRALIAGCPTGRVAVTVRAKKGSLRPRTASRPLRLDPPDCARFFSRRAFWNTPLPADAPLDPHSAEVTAELVRSVHAGRHSGRPATINTSAYTPPVYTVGPGHPRVKVELAHPRGIAEDLRAALASVPLPSNARGAAGNDRELVVWQPSTDTLWEFWQLRREGGGWRAAWGGRLEGVSTGPAVFGANWGTSASGLPLVGGLITPRELRAGRIEHALALGVPDVRAWEFARPARRTDGVSTCRHAVPHGARFRLDPALDVDALGLPPAAATIARAAQRYGIIVREQSGAVTFFAQNSSTFAADPYPSLFGGAAPWDLLERFPWDRLQLTRMELVGTENEERPLPRPQDVLRGCT
jgi:hypothetical protein